jgi:ribosome-interacting GTPase 1
LKINQIEEIRQKNKMNENYLNQIKQNLNKLKEEFDTASNISIQYEDSTFIKKIFVIISSDKGNYI